MILFFLEANKHVCYNCIPEILFPFRIGCGRMTFFAGNVNFNLSYKKQWLLNFKLILRVGNDFLTN